MAAAHIQSISTGTLSNVASIGVSFSAAVGSGHAVCGAVSWGTASSSDFNSVTDDKGNTYTRDIVRADGTNAQSFGLFYLNNITNAPLTVTASFGGKTPGPLVIVLHEASGISTGATPKDVSTGQLQTSLTTAANAVNSGTAATANNGDYLFGATVRTDATVTSPIFAAGSGSGYTIRENFGAAAGSLALGSESQVQVAAASTTATFQSSQTGITALTFLFAFSATSSAGGGATVVCAPRLTLLGVR